MTDFLFFLFFLLGFAWCFLGALVSIFMRDNSGDNSPGDVAKGFVAGSILLPGVIVAAVTLSFLEAMSALKELLCRE